MDENEFLDCNEQDSYIYGTTFSSVREVMSENKLCVIDCRPEVRHFFKNFQHCLKITEKVSNRATFTFCVDKSSLKSAKNGPVWRVFENLKLAVKQCYQTGQF